MLQYPVSIHIPPYRGTDEIKQIQWSERNKIAGKIENYINEKMMSVKKGESKDFTYSQIANDLNISKELAREILYRIDGGNGGVSIKK